MNRGLAIILLHFIYAGVCGQGYGAQWLSGDFPALVDFRNDTVLLHTIAGHNMSFLDADANICDSSGDLLFFSNGLAIYDKNGDLLENGDSLSPCAYTSSMGANGLNISQAVMFLPKPGNSNYFYLFHFSNDTLSSDSIALRPGNLLYSLIEKDSNGGLGKAVAKNVSYCKSIFREGGITACKHANGRDYWIIMGGSNNNEFYKFLLTPDSILGPYTQFIGPTYALPMDWGYSRFSQDGSKFVTGCALGLITVLDFDRCSGEFSKPVTIFNEASTDTNIRKSGCTAVEFSNNDRFVYVSNIINLNQYDLWSANYQDSVELYREADTDYTGIEYIQLTPNGKIYGNPYSGGFYSYHVINNPDLKGDSCNFMWGGQPTLSGDTWMPNMINYNLGPLIGSGCDTLTDTILSLNPPSAEKDLLRIMPNPADKYLYVEMGKQGDYEFDLLNSLGQVVASKQTRQVDIFDTEGLASGIYILRVLDKGNAKSLLSRKVVVGH
jgi:hypothetical protein